MNDNHTDAVHDDTGHLTQVLRDGLAFDVHDSGPLDGPVAVLLHGFPQDATAWNQVTERLTAHGIRCVAPDQRGYSPGARPSRISAYRMDELVADTLAIIDATGADRVHLVGHDWGGGLAWSFSTSHPDRLASLTVVSTPHNDAMAEAITHSDQGLRSWYMLAMQIPGLPEQLVSRNLGKLLRKQGLDADIARHYGERYSRPGALTGPMNWYRAILRSSLRPGSTSTGGLGSTGPVTVPTTFVWGNQDAALGRYGAEHTGEHVHADYRFVELDDDHWLPEKQPDAVADEILARIRSVQDGPAQGEPRS